VTSGDVFIHRLKQADYGLKAVAYCCSRGGTYGGRVGHSEVSWRHLAAKVRRRKRMYALEAKHTLLLDVNAASQFR
jgi:hypothetical protein